MLDKNEEHIWISNKTEHEIVQEIRTSCYFQKIVGDNYTIYNPIHKKGVTCQFYDYYSSQQEKNIEMSHQKRLLRIIRLEKELEHLRMKDWKGN